MIERRKGNKKLGGRIDQSRGDRKRFKATSEMFIKYKLHRKDYIVYAEVEKAEQLFKRVIDPREAIVSDEVYSNVEQGEKTSRKDLEEVLLAKRREYEKKRIKQVFLKK